ncbi:hypothetical protein B0T26DRAFT_638007 [Lasiosphaeria miniovina]|uniref:HNH nuclease domain-containing protein n=1 Tax=Lasiosphaeria miniovina TaxID=1954250 RepID=A0AA40B4X6_9PEZI|nr:uncharacterized protein B0T26DRAFT_638007 [Lasiosphaeria miniovina]KAK0727689.1 hypothetical protein B0T26DRAFT_638007 [Lasiosphaeria miniovina]
MDPASPTPHHRHLSSLEGTIYFSPGPALETGKRARAKQQFYGIIDHFQGSDKSRNSQYNRTLLVRLTYKYTRSEESQEIFLRAFFQAMSLSIDGEDDVDLEDTEEDLRLALSCFADYLLDNFFLPLRASFHKTPQPSPQIHSAVRQAQGGGVQDFVGTPDQVASLQGDCLLHNRYQYVISRRFDAEEANKHLMMHGDKAKDENGNLLVAGPRFSRLEVAHILPHSLTKTGNNSQLHPSKKAVLDILNMFNNRVIHLIKGTDINRLRNVITLTQSLHSWFGNFDIYFKPVLDQEHTYRIQSFLHPMVTPDLPVVHKLHFTKSRTIKPPSQCLLTLHHAISHILHLSTAAGYITKILNGMEWKDTRTDESTKLGRIVALKFGGWSEAVHT